ncbi:VOC family protein [Amphibacillus jilinensis]|uniref:SMU1112c/YaeR family gloxylase I-like metalloprotein n=1 Tax=Amphibacillus jilinensis TaxID=1216008 RepID=UPI00030FEC58|nr:VOC family protein [Amphibacillus jilinensis]
MKGINKFHHVAIIVSDYQKSKHFYTEVLGFKIISETYRHERQSYKLDLQVGEQDQIELFSFPSPPARVDHPEAAGLRHLAFQIDDINTTVGYLEQQDVNVEPIRMDPLTNKPYTFIKDPDGLPLELYSK